MEKLVNNQVNKIKDLSNEIKKFKLQKIELFRKFKEDKTVFEKVKNQRIRELFTCKKDNIKKESQIKKLLIENQKNAQINKKKEDELKRAKRVNETLKKLIKPANKK